MNVHDTGGQWSAAIKTDPDSGQRLEITWHTPDNMPSSIFLGVVATIYRTVGGNLPAKFRAGDVLTLIFPGVLERCSGLLAGEYHRQLVALAELIQTDHPEDERVRAYLLRIADMIAQRHPAEVAGEVISWPQTL